MKVYILVGIPGSGKSTWAHDRIHNDGDHGASTAYINQDLLGSRKACVKAFKNAAYDNKNIIVDRCNVTKAQRKVWIDLARSFEGYEVEVVKIIIKPDYAIKRIIERKGHPTIKEDFSLEKIRDIVYSFIKTWEEVTFDENITSIINITI